MMQAEQILEDVKATGGQLALIKGKLKGRHLNPEIRSLVKGHKAEIIQILSRQGQNFSCPAEEEIPVFLELKPCCLCGGVDFIHGHKGGFFCCECQPDARPGIPVKAAGNSRKKKLMAVKRTSQKCKRFKG